MKKIAAFFIFLIFSLPVFTQTLGVNGSPVAIIPHYDSWSHDFNPGSNYYYMHHVNRYNTGIRLEWNYYREDGNRFYPFFCDYIGLGVTAVFPFTDSASYELQRTNGGTYYVYKGTASNRMLNFGAHFGYRIPQEFNDFLSIFLGYGGGIMTARSVYPLPQLPNYTFKKEDFTPESFHSIREFTGNVEAFALFSYELEHFSITGQYSFLYSFTGARRHNGGLMDAHARHQVAVGIFYPLKRS